jgi:hypothetical protein
MGDVQPLPDYIKFSWGAVFDPRTGHIGFGYGWYVDYTPKSTEKPE